MSGPDPVEKIKSSPGERNYLAGSILALVVLGGGRHFGTQSNTRSG
jgi:hypothetical protein